MPDIDSQILNLIKTYTDTQARLIDTITAIEARGTVASYQRQMLAGVNEELRSLNEYAQGWVDETIPTSYQTGINMTYKSLREINLDIQKATANVDVVENLVANAFGQLSDANAFVGRQLYDGVRQAGVEASLTSNTMGEAVKMTKELFLEQLNNRGITSIVDKNGRPIKLEVYASMIARTLPTEATNAGIIQQVKDYGGDLVEIDTTATCCPICAVYEGRVYSVSGKDKRYPALDVAFSGDYLNLHPNCTHTLMPYVEDFDENPDKTQEDSNRPYELTEENKKMLEDYNAEQKVKAERRADRNEWEQAKVLAPQYTPATFSAFRSMKRAESDRYLLIVDEMESQQQVIAMAVEGKVNEVFYVDVITQDEIGGEPRGQAEIIKNPTEKQREQLIKEVQEEHNIISLEKDGSDVLRTTYDIDGNEYIWDAYVAIHEEVEWQINKEYGTLTDRFKEFEQVYGARAVAAHLGGTPSYLNDNLMVPIHGKYVEVYKNPTTEQLKQLEDRIKTELEALELDVNDRSEYQVRMVVDDNGNTYVWDAELAFHHDMELALRESDVIPEGKVKYNEMDLQSVADWTTLYQGEYKSVALESTYQYRLTTPTTLLGEEKETEIFYAKINGQDVEVLKNPTDDQIYDLKHDAATDEKVIYSDTGLTNLGYAPLRMTYDIEGNVYMWKAYDAIHAEIEPIIDKKFETLTSQNSYFDIKYSDERYQAFMDAHTEIADAMEPITLGIQRENEVTYVNIHGEQVEVIKNPTSRQEADLLAESEYGGDEDTAVRHTYDIQGNVYAWRGDLALHYDMEPVLDKEFHTLTQQYMTGMPPLNSFIDKYGKDTVDSYLSNVALRVEGFVAFTPEQLKTTTPAERAKYYVENLIQKVVGDDFESQWNGKITIVPRMLQMEGNVGRYDPMTGTILIAGDATEELTIIHELVHSFSEGLTNSTYRSNFALEEGIVQALTMEIATDNGITVQRQNYTSNIYAQSIVELAEMQGRDVAEYCTELLAIPLEQRGTVIYRDMLGVLGAERNANDPEVFEDAKNTADIFVLLNVNHYLDYNSYKVVAEGVTDPKAFEVFYLPSYAEDKPDIEILKNPTAKDEERFIADLEAQYHMTNEQAYSELDQSTLIRTSYDIEGNRYIWDANLEIHEGINPLINEKFDTLTSSINDIDEFVALYGQEEVDKYLPEPIIEQAIRDVTENEIITLSTGVDIYKNITPEQLEDLKNHIKFQIEEEGGNTSDPTEYEIRQFTDGDGNIYSFSGYSGDHMAMIEVFATETGRTFDIAGTKLTYYEDLVKDVALRVSAPEPQKYITAYKQFDVKDGELHNIMIDKKDPMPVGEWLAAELIPTKEFAERAGQHSMPLPIATQLRDRSGENAGNMDLERVWVQVSIPADVNWQETYAKNIVPEGGYYIFKSPSSDQPWYISGSMRIDKVLTNEEVADILTAAGREDQIPHEVASEATLQTVEKYITPEPDISTDIILENRYLEKGEAGTYIVYRMGDLFDPQGVAAFTSTTQWAEQYTREHPEATTDAYYVELANPFIPSGKGWGSTSAVEVYREITGQDPFTLLKAADGSRLDISTAEWRRKAENVIYPILEERGYDSIVYDRLDGIKEVVVFDQTQVEKTEMPDLTDKIFQSYDIEKQDIYSILDRTEAYKQIIESKLPEGSRTGWNGRIQFDSRLYEGMGAYATMDEFGLITIDPDHYDEEAIIHEMLHGYSTGNDMSVYFKYPILEEAVVESMAQAIYASHVDDEREPLVSTAKAVYALNDIAVQLERTTDFIAFDSELLAVPLAERGGYLHDQTVEYFSGLLEDENHGGYSWSDLEIMIDRVTNDLAVLQVDKEVFAGHELLNLYNQVRDERKKEAEQIGSPIKILSAGSVSVDNPWRIEVIQNPEADDIMLLVRDSLRTNDELRDVNMTLVEQTDAITANPEQWEYALNKAYDIEGNIYYWSKGTDEHLDVLKFIQERQNTLVSAENDFVEKYGEKMVADYAMKPISYTRFGDAGFYEVYRAGELADDNGIAAFTGTITSARHFIEGDETVERYLVPLENPYVFWDKNYTSAYRDTAMIHAYEDVIGDIQGAFAPSHHYTTYNIENAIFKELEEKGYDSFILKMADGTSEIFKFNQEYIGEPEDAALKSFVPFSAMELFDNVFSYQERMDAYIGLIENEIVGDAVPSQFSGVIKIDTEELQRMGFSGLANWNGDIELNDNTLDESVLIHELLHMYSEGRDDRTAYHKNPMFEEGAIEILTMYIMEKYQPTAYHATYFDAVRNYTEIAKQLGMDKVELARDVIQVDLKDRNKYLAGLWVDKWTKALADAPTDIQRATVEKRMKISLQTFDMQLYGLGGMNTENMMYRDERWEEIRGIIYP